jgi:hypothetical protein
MLHVSSGILGSGAPCHPCDGLCGAKTWRQIPKAAGHSARGLVGTARSFGRFQPTGSAIFSDLPTLPGDKIAENGVELRKTGKVRFADAMRVATHFFGEPRQSGSHRVFKMPWPGDPRINLQEDKGGWRRRTR